MEQPLFFCSSLFSLIVCLQNSSFLLGKKKKLSLFDVIRTQNSSCRSSRIHIVLWGLLIWCHGQNSSCRKCCTNVPWGQFSTVFFLYAFNDSYNRKGEIWILNVVNILRVTSQLSYNTLLHITWISFVSKYLDNLIWNQIL